MANYNIVAEISLTLGGQANRVLDNLRRQIQSIANVPLNLGNVPQLGALNASVSQLNRNLSGFNAISQTQTRAVHAHSQAFGGLRSSIMEVTFAYHLLSKGMAAVLEEERALMKFSQVNLVPMSSTRQFGQQARTTAIQTGTSSNALIELSTKLSQAGLSQSNISQMMSSRLLPKLLMSPEVGDVPDLVLKQAKAKPPFLAGSQKI